MAENKRNTENLPRISIVVVNKNLGNYLEDALCSILNQGYTNLDLILVDGGSADNSLEIIRKYEGHFSWWVSEEDSGQYEAVMKGFAKSDGEIMAWLNSDDMLHAGSLKAVAEIFLTNRKVEWLQGFPTEFSDSGFVINRIALPWARWSRWRYLTFDFQFIQQESTFWRRSLWEKAGAKLDTKLKLAGDLELWNRFFRFAKLYTTTAMIGGFRYRKGAQRSRDHLPEYLQEASNVIRKERKRFSLFGRFGLSVFRVIMFPFGIFFFFEIPLLKIIYPKIYGIPRVIRIK